MKYNYFYKITNQINGKFYYGVHSTIDLEDGYMGSGKSLKDAFKKYGINNFKKEILKFFETADDAYAYEKEIVTEELVKDDNCYNLVLGGGAPPCIMGMVPVKDIQGGTFWVTKEEYYFSKGNGLSSVWKGRHHTMESKEKTRKTMTPKDSKNKRIWVNKDNIVKYLNKKLLDEYLAKGWTLGRTGYKPRKNKQGSVIKE